MTGPRSRFCNILVAALVGATVAYPQAKQATVLDGVYTDAQAQRGQKPYEAICAACHEGDEPEAAPPRGSEFIERWREAPVSFLYGFVHANMPGNKPGSLSEQEYVDIVAYLLLVNGYHSGASELTAPKTSAILLVGPDGPKPLPIDASVSAVGCLTANPDGSWKLTSAANPVRVRSSDEATAEELAAARSAALGQASYKLNNAEDFPVKKMAGQKVLAKGVLTKVADPYTLSVHALESAGDGCGK